jgi:hypothetical protein
MPLLLLIPLLVLGILALWLVLLPLSLLARYRAGRARGRARGWVVRGNAWLLLVSLPVVLASSWVATRWAPMALRDAGIGLLIGVLFGLVSLWLTRFERDGDVLWFTPNRWPVLILTTLVAARIIASLWMTWRRVTHATPDAAAPWLDAGAWTAVAGVFLGYGLAYTWGLRARL